MLSLYAGIFVTIVEIMNVFQFSEEIAIFVFLFAFLFDG
jgi:hypothetical protein